MMGRLKWLSYMIRGGQKLQEDFESELEEKKNESSLFYLSWGIKL